jgi:sorting nexin-1/2
MGAYIAYNVLTRTTMPSFKNPECVVKRRFSDFLGLSNRISDKYMQNGRIVPPAPEKSVVGECGKVEGGKGMEGGRKVRGGGGI